jgi:hypothetical protein
MSARKPAYVILGVVVLLIAAGYFFWTRGVYVSITNNTQNVITRIKITYWSGAVHIATLEPATSYGRYVNPAAESGLQLEWLDSSGARHSRNMGGYLERNSAGSVQMIIEPDNRVLVINKVRSTLLPENLRRKPYFAEEVP